MKVPRIQKTFWERKFANQTFLFSVVCCLLSVVCCLLSVVRCPCSSNARETKPLDNLLAYKGRHSIQWCIRCYLDGMAGFYTFLVNLYSRIQLERPFVFSPRHSFCGKARQFDFPFVRLFVEIAKDSEIEAVWGYIDEDHVLGTFPGNLAQFMLETGLRRTLMGCFDFHRDAENRSISFPTSQLFGLGSIAHRRNRTGTTYGIYQLFSYIPYIIALQLYKISVRTLLPNIMLFLLPLLLLDKTHKDTMD